MSHLLEAVRHLQLHIEDMQRAVLALTGAAPDASSIVSIIGPRALPAPPVVDAPPTETARPRKPRAAKADAAPAGKPRKTPAAAPSSAAVEKKPTGRPPSAMAQTCRTLVLQTLAKHPTSMTFGELRGAAAKTLEAQGVKGLDLDNLLYAQNGALKAKGFLVRIGGAWSITDAGRAEVVRLRELARGGKA